MDAAYQSIIDARPRLRLTALPSPLERMPRLEASLRAEGIPAPRLYVKRDDLLGLAFGGNKIRNLEFLLGEALAAGATDIVTAGRAQSNHCRLTAAACAIAAIPAHLVLSGQPPPAPAGNLLLDHLFGATITFTRTDDRADREAEVRRRVAALEARGRRPATFAVGGSSPTGALGHVLAADEIAAQCAAAGEHDPLAVVLATATGGTQAGLLAGFAAAGRPVAIHGIAVAKSAADLAADVNRLRDDTCAMLAIDPQRTAPVLVDDRSLGAGYGSPTEDGAEASRLAARLEGLVLDPVYTAKGFAGFLRLLRAAELDPGGAALYVHTGGAPALFA